ncbi:uncharacterized protein PAC_12878 [Phialocephala subalpina]|uniref:DUF8035 domain-containing protein n=1 Tax=Phialocephala subalpina TaxID=576137 RepID=A0A1L7XD80_9HELO|nr:uncharacterized protein PAC_12878 [Phialocephala subalpina]
MTDRYRYGTRRGSPPLFNPARVSLPINLAYPEQQPHLHVVPSSRREIVPTPRSSNSSVSNAGTVTTTYKVTSDTAPKHGSHLREGSRTRRSTIDNHNRPTIVTTTRAHRPVVHSGGGVRPASPLKNPHRSSEEDYVVTPATSSRHGHSHHHHKKHYSVTMDNADMSRLAREREDSRLRVVPVREPTYRARSRPIYNGSVVRHADTVADDYGDDGYGYTNPQDLVRYDLDRQTQPVVHRPRRDSFDAGRNSRPTSISGYNDIVPRSYDTRERGPPPTMRGFDKIRQPPYDQATVRMPRPPSPGNSMAPMELVARPPPFEPVEPIRRTSGTRARPTSYHERDRPRGPREDYYEVRDDDRRLRHDSYDDRVESRGFGIRTDIPESRTAIRGERPMEHSERRESVSERRETVRPEHPDSRSAIRPERVERVERVERSDRTDRDRTDRDRTDRDRTDRGDGDRKEHKGRDALATSLSIAGAALGVNAIKNATRDDRDRKDSDSDEREERRRRDRDYDEEPRRRRDRDRDDREHVDLGGRDPKERRHRDDDMPPPPRDGLARDVPPPPRDPPRESRDSAAAHVKDRHSPVDPTDREPRERHVSREEASNNRDRRERHRQRSEAASNGTVAESSDTGSDDAQLRPRRETRPRGNSTAAAAVGAAAGVGAAVAAEKAFNPKDTMDLKALKEALNSKEAAKPKPVESKEPSRTPRQSSTKDATEVAKIREDLNSDRRGRDPLAPTENRQLRVVSPPREKADDKPVKGILRQPREKFPEDPAPIREGVAPLKDAKRDGIPPDARWTKISRKLVNPEALEAGKERYEAREDFVIVLRVLSRDEVQGYAEVTQRIRAAREELEEIEAAERRRARRERHERHKRERSTDPSRSRRHRHRDPDRESSRRDRDRSSSESDTTDDELDRERDRGDKVSDKPKMLEAPKKRATFEDALMTGGLGGDVAVGSGSVGMGSLKETSKPGVYSGYVRNPPPPKNEY